MTRLENVEGVTEIVMHPIAYTKCQIGQDWFLNQFEVHFIPGKFYPDYMEIDSYVNSYIEGKELNIEQASKLLYDQLKLYEPKAVKVIDHVRNCKTHFNVDVTIE